MSRTYYRGVCDGFVFEVTDENVSNDLSRSFPKAVPLGDIDHMWTNAYRRPLSLFFPCLGLALTLSYLTTLLIHHGTAILRAPSALVFFAVLIIIFMIPLRDYVLHPMREIIITTTDGGYGVLFNSADPKTFEPFYAALQTALAEQRQAAGATPPSSETDPHEPGC